MTQAQKRKINFIRKQAENMHGKQSDSYEIKRWEVTDNEWGTVTLFVEIGLKGDEGTMAEYLARDSVQIFIGPRGAAKFPCYKARKNGTFHNYYKPLKDLWMACYDYKTH